MDENIIPTSTDQSPEQALQESTQHALQPQLTAKGTQNTSEESQPIDAKLRFFHYFSQEVFALRKDINSTIETTKSDSVRTKAVERWLASISRLSNDVTEASSYIPAYDQKAYTDAIKALNDKVAAYRKNFAPKPKFSFKTRLGQSNKTEEGGTNSFPRTASEHPLESQKAYSSFRVSDEAVTLVPGHAESHPNYAQKHEIRPPADDDTNMRGSVPTQPGVTVAKAAQGKDEQAIEDGGGRMHQLSLSQETSVNLSNKNHAHIVFSESASQTVTTGNIANLRGCVVDLSRCKGVKKTDEEVRQGSFASVQMRNVRQSLVILGRVNGPIHITALQDCVVVVACRQFRMHDCHNVDIYLECGSHPIIEDCDRIRFAPLPQTLKIDAGSKDNDYWGKVRDFKWLKAEASPHWTIKPESERVREEVWSQMLSAEPAVSIERIFQVVGLSRVSKSGR